MPKGCQAGKHGFWSRRVVRASQRGVADCKGPLEQHFHSGGKPHAVHTLARAHFGPMSWRAHERTAGVELIWTSLCGGGRCESSEPSRQAGLHILVVGVSSWDGSRAK